MRVEKIPKRKMESHEDLSSLDPSKFVLQPLFQDIYDSYYSDRPENVVLDGNSKPRPQPKPAPAQLTSTPKGTEKRKRGRPRIYPAKSPFALKRPVGRPRKIHLEDDVKSITISDFHQFETIKQEEVDVTEKPSIVNATSQGLEKRKRGRPRLNQTVPLIKRPVGRPRKDYNLSIVGNPLCTIKHEIKESSPPISSTSESPSQMAHATSGDTNESNIDSTITSTSISSSVIHCQLKGPEREENIESDGNESETAEESSQTISFFVEPSGSSSQSKKPQDNDQNKEAMDVDDATASSSANTIILSEKPLTVLVDEKVTVDEEKLQNNIFKHEDIEG